MILLDIAESADTSTFSLTITDGIFMDITNSSSAATLWAVDVANSAATINLNGCISFIRTTGPEVSVAQGVLNDQRRGPCPDSLLDEFGRVTVIRPPEDAASRGEERVAATPLPAVTPTPAPSTILSLPAHIRVSGYYNSTQGQQVGRDGIGNQSVLDAGFVDAVDIWGYVPGNLRVCFDGSSGRILFLDAATSPRAVSELPAYSLNGMICANLNRAGTVVLIQGPPAPTATAPLQPTVTPPASWSLSNCMVRTLYALNFRASPGGAVMSVLPYDVTLTALERTADWFKVDYHGGAAGSPMVTLKRSGLAVSSRSCDFTWRRSDICR